MASSRTRSNTATPSRLSAKPWTWVVVAVALAAAVAVFIATASSEPTAEGPSAPDLELAEFDGGTVRLADFQGKPLVVNFWASWCVPCLAELPGFVRIHQANKNAVAFLGINLADDPGSAEAVREQTGITYPLARDPDGSAFEAFGGFGMPTTVFVSPQGTVIELYTGELTAEALAEGIARYFPDL